MIIRARELDPEGVQFDLPMDLGPLSSDTDESITVESLTLAGRASPTKNGLAVRGRLSGRALLPCARCCTPYELSLDRDFELFYAFPDAFVVAGKEVQIPDVELDYACLQEGDCVDLKQVATEQIYLEIPMKPLCRPACLGLCPRCGANRNESACGCRGESEIS